MEIKKNFDFVVRIFRQEDQKNKFFMNLYNKIIQIVEIKNERVEKSQEDDSKWEMYTYKSSKPSVTGYNKVIAKVNPNLNKSKLEIFVPNISKTVDNKNKKNLIELDGCNTVVEAGEQDNFIKEENIVNSSMVSYPKMDSSTNSLCSVNDLRSIVSKDDFNLKNLLRKKDRYNWILNIVKYIRNDIDFLKVIPDLDSDSLLVKDQVQSLDDTQIWYELFYNKTNDNISFTTGWTQKK